MHSLHRIFPNTMHRITILLLTLLPTMAIYAQSESFLYGKAMAYANKGCADSTFYYLDRMATLYGDRDPNLYPGLLTEPQLRPYHADMRWKACMARYRTAKHTAEDMVTKVCQTDTVHKADNTPIVNHYDIDLSIDIAAKRLCVSAGIDIDFRGNSYADLYLWRHTQIGQIAIDHQPARYEFATDISAPWITDAGRLRIYGGKSLRQTRVTINYTSLLDSIDDDSFAACDSNMVMLTYYMGWYPTDINHEASTAQIDIHLSPADYKLTGSGIISRKDGTWHMDQPWKGFDYTLIASRNLRQKTINRHGHTIEVVSLGFPEADADSVAYHSADILDLYSHLFRHRPNERQLRIFLFPQGGDGAYSRRNFIVCCSPRYNEWLYQLLAHEIGHFWWNSAPTDNWEDWLNESFAEFSSLCAIRHHLGSDVYHDYIEAYREWARTACPIRQLAREANGARYTFYHKGAILLYDLKQQVGSKRFYGFLHRLTTKQIGSQDEFEREARRYLGQDILQWIDQRLGQ